MLLRHIAEHEHHADDTAIKVADGRGAVGDGPLRAVARNQHGVVRQTVDLAGGQHVVHGDDGGLARLLVDDIENFAHRPALRLGVRPAGEFLGDGVEPGDAPLRVGGQHGVADGLERDGEFLLAAAQGDLRLLLLRDVARGGEDVSTPVRHGFPRERAPRAVLVLVAVLKIQDLFAGGKFLHLPHRGGLVFGMHKFQERPRQQLLRAPAQRVCEGGIDALEITVRVGDAEHVQREGEEEVQFSLHPQAAAVLAQHEREHRDEQRKTQTRADHRQDVHADHQPHFLLFESVLPQAHPRHAAKQRERHRKPRKISLV